MIANPTAGKGLSHSWWYHLSAVCLMSWHPSVCFLPAKGDLTTIMKRKPLQSHHCSVTLTTGKWKSLSAPESPPLTFTVAQQRLVGFTVTLLSHDPRMLSHAAVITGNESKPLKQTETFGVRLAPSVKATPPADFPHQEGMSPVLPPCGIIICWSQLRELSA